MWDHGKYKLSRSYRLVLLAGGYMNGDPKALVKVAGKPMVYHVLRAVRKLKGVKELAISAPPEAFEELQALLEELRLNATLTEAGETPLESFRRGAEALDATDELVIALATDMPLVTTEAVQDVLLRIDMLAREGELDVAYPVVSKEAYKIRYPDSRRTFLSLKRGSFCGTGLVALKPSVVDALAELVDSIVRSRKSPLKMASIIGWDLLISLLLRRYTLLDLEDVLSRRFNLRGRVLLSEYPELAFNVDEPEEVLIAERYIERRG